jgi:hypothetical protein
MCGRQHAGLGHRLLAQRTVGLDIQFAHRHITVTLPFVFAVLSQEVEDLYEIHDILQTAAIQRMPLPCSHSSVESLQDLCDEHQNAVTPQELLLSNNRFHECFFGLYSESS